MSSNAKVIARIDLKTAVEVRDHIDRGAAAVNKSRTEFMLDAAMVAADEALMSRHLFPMDSESWDEFNLLLDDHDWASDQGFVELMDRTPRWQ